MLALALASGILVAYAASLWWLLRRESATALIGIVAVCGVALSLRLAYTTDFPAGLNEDEPKILGCANADLRRGRLWVEGCTGLPALLNTLFQAQLVPVLGPNRWAIRSYSLVTSVLSSPAAFAVGRGAGLALGSSLALASFVAVLPWSVFYGRISVGGELVFHEMLLLAALMRLVFAEGVWAAVGVGTLGQSLLFYDYFCGRLIAPITVVAAVLARGRRRLLCLAIPLFALVSWLPYLQSDPPNGIRGVLRDLVHEGFATHPLQTLWERTLVTVPALVRPGGADGFLTVRAAAMHPRLILVLAGLALLLSVRRFRLMSFITTGFLIGLAPAVFSNSIFPSPHRMLMAFAFIALAAAAALDAIPWRNLRIVVTSCAIAVIGVQSVHLYFSSKFWSPNSRAVFDWETTGLVEALPAPPHEPLIIMRQVGYYITPRAGADTYTWLTMGNWFPPNNTPSLYAFTGQAALLLPFYESLVGQQRIQSFGRAFLVRFEGADWSWLRQHGWAFEARCGKLASHGAMPTLFQPSLDIGDIVCSEPITDTWQARWSGPATQARLLYAGTAVVEVDGNRVVDKTDKPTGQTSADFSLQPAASIKVTVTDFPWVWAALVQLTPAGERLPPWEWLSPIEDGEAAAPPG